MSGRSLSDVRKRVGIRKIYYGGNHGFVISGPGFKNTDEKALAAQPLIRRAKRLLKRGINDIEGAWVEDKKFTVSLHFRTVNKDYIPILKKLFYKVAGEFLGKKSFGVIRGKKVLELTPDLAWNKGRAVLWILHHQKDKWLPIYVGDDKTDETAFAALKKGGITIRVGRSKSTRAKYYVKGYWEIPGLLEEIEKCISA
jgi:trehalose-phosphatase